MKYTPFLVIFISCCFSSLLAQEQCDSPLLKEYNWNNTTLKAIYCGETDDTNKPEGYGKMIYETIEYGVDFQKGYWKDGKLNGEGMEVFRDGRVYIGNFIDGKISFGSETWQQHGIVYNGGFRDYKYNGENGVLSIVKDDFKITQEGLFKSDLLVDGISVNETKFDVTTQKGIFFNNELENGQQIIQENKSGIIIKSTYLNGVEEVTYRNDQNSYNSSDVLGSSSSAEVAMEKKGSIDKGKLAYYVTLEIDGISGDFLLDTGAMGFSIGKKMFERLKGQGIEFLDLNKKVASVGVGGESQGKLILLNNVKIGNYTLSNVVASVSLENNFSLLGTGFLLKFSNVIWNMKKETLILYK